MQIIPKGGEDVTKEEIGRIIRESRISAELTQQQVAKRLDRPQQTIASWESGKSQPDANTLFELFRVFGRSVDEAFGFTESTMQLSVDAQKLARDYDSLDEDKKRMVRETTDRALEMQASMDRLIERVRVLRLYDYYLNVDSLEESGIDLTFDVPCENPFVIPEHPPKSQVEVFEKLKNRELTQPIGIHFRHDGQYDKIFIVDLGTQAVEGGLGLYNINGRSFLAKVRAGKFFLHPYNRNPVMIQKKPRCDGAVIGFISSKTVYR